MESGYAFNGAIEIIEPANVGAVRPLLWARWRRRMPQMESMRVAQYRNDSTPHPAKSERNVVVLATPSNEALVETIHRFEVGSRNPNVVAGKLRLFGMAHEHVIR